MNKREIIYHRKKNEKRIQIKSLSFYVAVMLMLSYLYVKFDLLRV
jgi:hypothetical protein